jgi:hypothetical protein
MSNLDKVLDMVEWVFLIVLLPSAVVFSVTYETELEIFILAVCAFCLLSMGLAWLLDGER